MTWMIGYITILITVILRFVKNFYIVPCCPSKKEVVGFEHRPPLLKTVA